MKLTFLGTRGEIDARTPRHRRHTSLLVEYRRKRVMIDCGEDWRGHIDQVRPQAIVLTHGHPDHAWGLSEGAPCPVYATEATWEDIDDYPIDDRHTVEPGKPLAIRGIGFLAHTVEHSTRCPAVGYRVEAGRAAFWYAPDVVYIHQRGEALQGVALYVGDGATLARSMVRKQGDRLIGHTPVRTQLTWCRKEGVPEAIITHCGSGIVEGDERKLIPQVQRWACRRGLAATIAHDGMEKVLR
ncbi:MAG: MBL fold metallo-hydrolase [Phycisphaerae bacterium]